MPKHRTKPLKSKAEKCQTLGHSIFKNYGITKPPLRSSAKANPKSKPKSNRFTSITQTSNSLLAKFGYLDKRSAHLQSLESLELNLSERSNILALQRTCDSLSDLLSTYCTPVQNIEPEREIFRLDFGSTIHLLKVISTISRVKNRHRTAGCVLIKGDINPKLTALSGWKNNEEAICEGLLDSSVWTEAVIRFCALIGHDLPANMGDKKRKGEFNACHVEKQLALGFVCHAIYDENGGVDQQKLHELRTLNPKLQVEIHVSLDPCHNCLDFVQKLGRISGIDFEVLTIRDVVEVEKAKNDNGVRTEVRLLTQKRRREKEKKKLRKGMLRERRELMKAMADRTDIEESAEVVEKTKQIQPMGIKSKQALELVSWSPTTPSKKRMAKHQARIEIQQFPPKNRALQRNRRNPSYKSKSSNLGNQELPQCQKKQNSLRLCS